jgi:hypothetical protein
MKAEAEEEGDRKEGTHLPYFVQILPKLQLGGVGTQLAEVSAQELLPVEDLGTVLVRLLVYRALEARAPGRKGPRCDIIPEELLVHDVHDSGDECLDILGPGGQCFYVICITASDQLGRLRHSD